MEHNKPVYWDGDDIIIRIRVQTRAKSRSFQAVHNNRFKLSLTAAPVNGQANKQLCTWLAKEFSVSKKSVSLVSGEYSCNKIVRITVPGRIPPLVSGAGDFDFPAQGSA